MAQYIEIGRRGEVSGPLVAKEVMVRDRGKVEDIYAERVTLRRDCRANNVYAARIEIESGCRIRGEVKYTDTLRLDRDVDLEVEPEKTEKLPPPPF
jgi:cytoskeletal protein CcmA (bactofilin family)